MRLPTHLAIIMDGNGRWAQRRGHSRTYGHVKGSQTAKKIITESVKLGIKNLTLYAFSSENWRRPEAEVFLLMRILQRYMARERATLLAQNIRFRYIGDASGFPPIAREELERTVQATASCTGMNLVFALGYGARQEIVETVRDLIDRVVKKEISLSDVSEATVSGALSTSFLPDPDLIIRTSGEQRLSNFLLWQAAYSEFYFTSTLWPDFGAEELGRALRDYSERERRFGKTGEQMAKSAGSGRLGSEAKI